MNNLIKKILVEWSFRLDDGMINLHNPKHMLILSEVLKDMKLPTRAILEVMSNLTEKEKVKPLSDKDKQKMRDMGLTWKGKGYGKEGEKGILFKNVDGKLVKTGDGKTQKTEPKVNVFKKDEPEDTTKEKPKNKKTQTKREIKTIKGMSREQVDSVDGDVKNRFFEGKETAPGTKSSAMNEIGAGWGLSVLNDNPNASTEEVMQKVDEMFKKNGVKLSKKHLKSIANSSKREHTRVHRHMDKKGMNPETTKVSHVWGAKPSLEALAKQLDELRKKGVKKVNGIDIDDYIEIVRGGGGGGDPTDTMVLMTDESQTPPKVEILHTSNKMSNADIQSNSTPIRSLYAIDEDLKNSDMSDEEKEEVKKETKKARDTIRQKDKEISRVVSAQGDKLENFDDKALNNQLDALEGNKPPEISSAKGKYWRETVLRNKAVKDYMKENSINPGPNGENLSREEKLAILRVYNADLNKRSKTSLEGGEPLTKGDIRILSKVAENEDKITGKPKTEPEFDEEDVNQLYRDQFDAINNMRKTLNEKHNGYGDEVFKKEMISRMHLNVAEGHNPGSSETSEGIPEENFELNMGRNESSIKYDKETGEMYQRIGRKYFKIDPKTGKKIVPEVEKKIGELEEGDIATIATPEIIASCVAGDDYPLEEGTLQDKIKVKEAETVEEGRQQIYIIYDLEGNEICRQTVRSKTGLGGTSNDEIKWSPDMMACMQRKSHNIEKGIE